MLRPVNRSVQFFVVPPFHPRSPQQQSKTGQSKDGLARSFKMRIIRFLFLALLLLAIPVASFAQFGVSITIAPPALPVYEQPPCPAEGYLWTPGYWAYADANYYWVPGTWVQAPEVGFLWTPGYWGWGGDRYVFNEGYWGPHVGFYGGISYGFGYFGEGYEGGRWDNGRFFYNRSVNNVNETNIHNTYNTTVINNTTVNRVSYNGGNGGINARPTAEQESAAHERHIAPVAAQTQHEEAARSEPQQRASVNHGSPAIAATAKPGEMNARAAVPKPPSAVHPNELPARERLAPPNTGNAKLDQKYQQQQDKVGAQQDKERQKLQQQQEKEHQTMARQNADEATRQQVEQRHQQQTQQLQQKHEQQQQQLKEKQQRPA